MNTKVKAQWPQASGPAASATKVASYRIMTEQRNVGELLQWCQTNHHVDRMLLVVRLARHTGRWQPLWPQQYSKAIELFGRYIISRDFASGWPGTRLFGHAELVLLLKFDDSVRTVVAKAGPRFRDWIPHHPYWLPEDICLFRHGADIPTLISVTHENDAWLLTEKPVQLTGVVKSNDLDEVLSHVFNGKWFCRRWRGRRLLFTQHPPAKPEA